jgi:hypothetical protein
MTHTLSAKSLVLLALCACRAALLLTGCAAAPAFQPDHPAGKTLVVYWGKDRDTKRVAYAVADHAGAALFDLSAKTGEAGKATVPDPRSYDNFFIGVPVAEGVIPPPAASFLNGTDFLDGYAAVVWTSRAGRDEAAVPLASQVRGARLMGERGFSAARQKKRGVLAEEAGDWAEGVLAEIAPRHAVGLQAEYVMKAYAQAYPERITETAFREGDWALCMDGVWYYYAEGRIIPEEERQNRDRWLPQWVYRYSLEKPNEVAEAGPLRQRLETSRRFQFSSGWGWRGMVSRDAKRYPFYEAILGTGTREEAAAQQQRIPFLGYTVTAHRMLAAPLALIEKRLLQEEAVNEEVRAWLASVYSITAWNWRNIAGSDRISFHAYGIAVDLQMRPRAGMETYWQWTAQKGIDWRSVPHENRLEPPPLVVRVFEENGFLWGGKWPMFDTMHFEYRPEIALLLF